MSEYSELKNRIKDIKVLLGKDGGDVAKMSFCFLKSFYRLLVPQKTGLRTLRNSNKGFYSFADIKMTVMDV